MAGPQHIQSLHKTPLIQSFTWLHPWMNHGMWPSPRRNLLRYITHLENSRSYNGKLLNDLIVAFCCDLWPHINHLQESQLLTFANAARLKQQWPLQDYCTDHVLSALVGCASLNPRSLSLLEGLGLRLSLQNELWPKHHQHTYLGLLHRGASNMGETLPVCMSRQAISWYMHVLGSDTTM